MLQLLRAGVVAVQRVRRSTLFQVVTSSTVRMRLLSTIDEVVSRMKGRAKRGRRACRRHHTMHDATF